MTKANGRSARQARPINDTGMSISVHKDDIFIARKA